VTYGRYEVLKTFRESINLTYEKQTKRAEAEMREVIQIVALQEE